MILLLLAAATAAELTVAIHEEDGAFSGAVPRVTVTDATGQSQRVDVQDGGTAPDAAAGDTTWTGMTRALGAGPYTFLITDGGDIRVWKGQFAGSGGETGVVRLSAKTGGVLTEVGEADVPVVPAPAAETHAGSDTPPAPPPPEGSGEPGSPQPTGGDAPAGEPNPGGSGGGSAASEGGGGSPGPAPSASSPGAAGDADLFSAYDPWSRARLGPRTLAWALVVGAIAWVLAGARRFTASAVDPLPGARPPLGSTGVVPMDGAWDAFVRTLAGPFRVVLAGAGNPGPVPAGTVFPLGTGRVAVDDVLALAAHLEPTGPPVIIVIVGGLEGGDSASEEAALAELGRRLPNGGVAYVFANAASRLASSDTPR